MLFRSLFTLSGLIGFVLGHPFLERTNEVAASEGIYITEPNGVQRRAKIGIEQELLDRFILYSEYCAAAYCGPQQGKAGGKVSCGSAKTCPKVEALDTKIYSTWYAKDSSGATGFVSVDNTNKLIVLAMRGSVSIANWIADAKFVQTKCDEIVPKGLCSIGFLNFWNESKEKAMQGIKAAVVDHPNYEFIVTGHSLGGAAAVYATIEMRKLYGVENVTMYTYGQPRAGDEILTKFITDQGQNFRVTHTSDAVPKLPPEAGPGSGLTGVYKHISPEYWISDGLGNKKDKIKVVEGLSSNEGNAGTGQLKFNIVAHIQYFQTNMYYCAMPFPLGVLGGAGSRKRDVGVEVEMDMGEGAGMVEGEGKGAMGVQVEEKRGVGGDVDEVGLSSVQRGVERMERARARARGRGGVKGDMGEEGNEGEGEGNRILEKRSLPGMTSGGKTGNPAVFEERDLQRSSRWDVETRVEDLLAMGLGQGVLTEFVDLGL